MGRGTIFRISSMTKPVTAVATMILLEECLLRLDEPVDRLLPEVAGRRVLKRIDGPLEDTVPGARPITVRDLLTFCMGFGIIMAEPDSTPLLRAMSGLRLGQGPPDPQKPPGGDEWIRNLGTLPLVHQPGERWMYNTGSDVLGVLIARPSGRPFEAFLRERVFESLGMSDTGFSVPGDDIGRLATAYRTDPATGGLSLYDDPPTGQWSVAPRVARDWCPRSTTTWRSARCCWTGAGTGVGASSRVRPSRR
jgi:CubicO group peptidase (beta-lactamase class C family)